MVHVGCVYRSIAPVEHEVRFQDCQYGGEGGGDLVFTLHYPDHGCHDHPTQQQATSLRLYLLVCNFHLFGDEALELFRKQMSLTRKTENQLGWFRKDLSYYPEEQAQ